MRINTSWGEMEYSPEVYRGSITAAEYADAVKYYYPGVFISDFYVNKMKAAGAVVPIIKPNLTMTPIFSPTITIEQGKILDVESAIHNAQAIAVAQAEEQYYNNLGLKSSQAVIDVAAAEKKRLSEYISPEAILVEQQRIIENTITPEQANLNLIEAENNQRWKETLLEVAVTQEKYPEAIFLQGTAPELIEWEKTAADLGITIPLKAAEITTDGKVSGKVFDLQSQQVKPDSQAQPDLFISVSWLDRVVNYIYKQIHKN